MMKLSWAVFKFFGLMVVAAVISGSFFGGAHSFMQGAFTQQAFAQDTLPGLPPLGDDEIVTTTSAKEMAQLFKEIGIETQIIQSSDGGVPRVLAITPDGGRFYLQFVGCKTPLEECGGVFYRAAISNAGITYDDLNSYNIQALVIKAVNIADSNLIFFVRHNVVVGGVQRNYLKVSVALFLRDMDVFLKSQAASTSVAFSPNQTNQRRNKIDPISSSDAQNSAILNSVVDASLIESAIYNTRNVRFMTPEAKLLVQGLIE